MLYPLTPTLLPHRSPSNPVSNKEREREREDVLSILENRKRLPTEIGTARSVKVVLKFGEYLLLFGMASLGNTYCCSEWRIWGIFTVVRNGESGEYLLLFGMANLGNIYCCSEWRIWGIFTAVRNGEFGEYLPLFRMANLRCWDLQPPCQCVFVPFLACGRKKEKTLVHFS